MIKLSLSSLLVVFLLAGCGEEPTPSPTAAANPGPSKPVSAEDDPGLATFGGGCYWCTEAIFEEIEGVDQVLSGFSGGDSEEVTYEQVCFTNTGHAEVVQIHYDPKKVDYRRLLDIFFSTHDPTTPNRQGADVGPQYRSAVFYHTEHQKKLADETIAALNASGRYSNPIVTEVAAYKNFVLGPPKHQDFFRKNPRHDNSQAVIQPKVEKMRKQFKDMLKQE